MNKFLKNIIIFVIVISLGYYFWSIIDRAITGKKVTNTLKMWVAPDSKQEAFWKEVVPEWNKSNLGMKVEFTTIPAAQSSEEAIFNSIASCTSPDICTNIFSGFGAQLASISSIYNLQEFEGYDELIKQRQMKTLMEKWLYNDENYVFPIYYNPAMYAWRWDILQKLGWDTLPLTYSDVLKLGKQFYVPHKKYPLQLLSSPTWWSRWWDFISFYYAASSGKPYIENNKAAFNNEYGRAVMNFIQEIVKKGYTPMGSMADEDFYRGNIAGKIFLPSDIRKIEANYPKIISHIKLAPVPVPDNHKGNKYMFADSKGVVIFKSSRHPQEAWKFVKWVFSQDKYSLLWLEYTTNLPARGDILTNPIFKNYLKGNRFAAEYAKYINYTVPPASITKTIYVQEAMTNKLIEPIKYQTESVDSALKNTEETINHDLASKY